MNKSSGLVKAFDKARLLYENEQYAKAISGFSRIIRKSPQHWSALNYRALSFAKKGDFDHAIADFEKALTLQPQNAEIYSNRALVYHYLGENKLSMDDFNKAAEIEPENGYRYASRAFIKDRQGDLLGALDDYNKAIEIDPEDAISINNKGMVEEKMGYASKAKKSFGMADEIARVTSVLHEKNAATKIAENTLPEKEKSTANEGKKITFNKYFSTIRRIFTEKGELKAFVNFCLRLIKK